MRQRTKRESNLFNKILIASRGEIAVRIIKTTRKLGIASVAIYTADEKNTLHVQQADEAFLLNGKDPLSAFLDVHQIISIAKKCGADAIHPGYGFLSENPIFAELCKQNNIAFIGPSAHQIALMGDKAVAIEEAKKANVPTIEGALGSIQDILNKKNILKYPLLVKPAFGGGGKGMVEVIHAEKLEEALHKASAEALRYFSNDTIIVEHFIESPRHIEVQILGDNFGNIIHLFERECSVQRRFQKIIEETPAPNLPTQKRDEIITDALKLARQIGYVNAGTIEFLLSPNGEHYFIEMNTRIQVEHPITEEVTGFDIVELQIEIASGLPLQLTQNDVRQNGFAIECRINAENPHDNFNPSPGDVFWLNKRDFSHLRIDTSLKNHSKITPSFDSLIAKVITHQPTRQEAINLMITTLNELAINSKHNNIGYLINILQNRIFQDGSYNTTFCNNYNELLLHQTDKRIPANFFYQIGWSLIRLKHFFKSHLFECKKPINSIFQLWSESEFGINYIELEWQNSESAKVTINNKEIYLVTNILIEENNVLFTVMSEPVSQFYLITGIESIICYEMHFFHLWEVGRKATNQQMPLAQTSDKCELTSEIPCKIVAVKVSDGQQVAAGDTLVVVEAMKMENSLKAWKSGVVEELAYKVGDAIKADAVILKLR